MCGIVPIYVCSEQFCTSTCRQTARGSLTPILTSQWVWLSNKNLKLKLPSQKVSPRYIGPFKVFRQINPVIYHLHLPSNYRMSPSFHASLLKPAHAPHCSVDTSPAPLPPLEIDGTPAYVVRSLLDSQYLFWEGYSPEE